ncbi:MAG: ketoacyl-ACP synthase III [Candidatus Cloacimonetes bacterium]|nr:ketoacyl-ACP synthase III [Candidatus Cloacimonadota bacterium]
MGSEIIKITYHLPEKVLDNKDIKQLFPEFNSLKVLKNVGIQQRHIAGDNETALDLAYEAAEKLLIQIDRSTIDMLILCTQSPEYYLPTGACILQHKLGLPTHCGAFDISLGCSAYMYGLATANGFISSGIATNILLLTGDTLTKHIASDDKANMTIFGDAATATLIRASEREAILAVDLGTNGSGWQNLINPVGGFRYRANGNENKTAGVRQLYMDGPEILNFTMDTVPCLIENVLSKARMKLDDIDSFVFHQANKFILDTLCSLIDIPEDKFIIDMENYGNTVSSSIPIVLANMAEQGRLSSGTKVLTAGFGVGYSWGAVIIEW